MISRFWNPIKYRRARRALTHVTPPAKGDE